MIRIGAISALAVFLAGCETAGTVTSGAACEIFEPITYSRKDTAVTRDQVRSHNAAGKAACGWK